MTPWQALGVSQSLFELITFSAFFSKAASYLNAVEQKSLTPGGYRPLSALHLQNEDRRLDTTGSIGYTLTKGRAIVRGYMVYGVPKRPICGLIVDRQSKSVIR